MKRVIACILLLWLFFVPVAPAGWYYAGGGGGGCNLGYDSIGGTDQNSSSGTDSILCNLWSPSCSGDLGTGYLYHGAAYGPQNAKVAVYLDDGDSSPDSGDTLVGSSGALISSSEEWVSDAMSGGSVLSTNNYWVCFIFDGTTNWERQYDSGLANKYDLSVAGAYASPPADLSGMTFLSTDDRKTSMYVTVE